MKFVKVIYHSIFNEGILNLMKQLDIHWYRGLPENLRRR